MSDAPSSESFAAILVMAGAGRRFGGEVPKVHVDLAGVPVWRHAAEAFARSAGCTELILVAAADRVDAVRASAADLGAIVVAGGAERQDSVAAGLRAVQNADVVLIHDAARPLIDADAIVRVATAAAEHGAALAVARVIDTIKRVDGTDRVTETVERAELRSAQTPQGFRRQVLADAHAAAAASGLLATDDAALVEANGGTVVAVEVGAWNLKITGPDDLVVAAALLEARDGGTSA